MPLYVSSGEYRAQLYKDECGFSELGEHVSLILEPEYRWKYLVFRPCPQESNLANEGKESIRFDFGWRAIRDL